MKNTNKDSSKLISDENKQKAMSFATSLCIGLLKGLKACIETLHEKLLPKINAKLETIESKDKE